MSEQDPKWEVGDQVFDLVTSQPGEVYRRRLFHGAWVYTVVVGKIGTPRLHVERFQSRVAGPNEKSAATQHEDVAIDLPGFPDGALVTQDHNGLFQCTSIGLRMGAIGSGHTPEAAVDDCSRVATDLQKTYGRQPG